MTDLCNDLGISVRNVKNRRNIVARTFTNCRDSITTTDPENSIICEEFTTPGAITRTAPLNINHVDILLLGGGGGGGGGQSN